MFAESNDTVVQMPSFNERLRRLMEEKGVKAADLARKTGLSKPTLSAIIHGTTNDPRISSVISISKVLGCDPFWLFVGQNNSNYSPSSPTSKKVPVWQLKDMYECPRDELPFADTGRYLIVEDGGRLCGVIAENDDLLESGIHMGDICIIDLNKNKPQNGDVLLVEYRDRLMLLRAKCALDGMILVADDPRIGSITSEDDAIILGCMVELRRM